MSILNASVRIPRAQTHTHTPRQVPIEADSFTQLFMRLLAFFAIDFITTDCRHHSLGSYFLLFLSLPLSLSLSLQLNYSQSAVSNSLPLLKSSCLKRNQAQRKLGTPSRSTRTSIDFHSDFFSPAKRSNATVATDMTLTLRAPKIKQRKLLLPRCRRRRRPHRRLSSESQNRKENKNGKMQSVNNGCDPSVLIAMPLDIVRRMLDVVGVCVCAFERSARAHFIGTDVGLSLSHQPIDDIFWFEFNKHIDRSISFSPRLSPSLPVSLSLSCEEKCVHLVTQNTHKKTHKNASTMTDSPSRPKASIASSQLKHCSRSSAHSLSE